jgi:hypothetical protein
MEYRMPCYINLLSLWDGPHDLQTWNLDFYFWWYVMHIVYSVRNNNIQHLKLRITPDILGRVRQEMEYFFMFA